MKHIKSVTKITIIVVLFVAVVFSLSTGLAKNLNSVESGKWEYTGSMKEPRFLQGITLLNDDRVLTVGGGYVEPIPITTEIYNTTSEAWTTSNATLNTIREGFFRIVTLNSGEVLIAGGWDRNYSDLASVEIYNPSTDSWSYTTSLNTPRRNLALVKLLDGRVMAIGGAYGGPHGGRFLSSVEIYDPDSRTWTYTGDLNIARESHFALTLHDGRVLVLGGEGPWWVVQDTAEIYDPSTGVWSISGDMSTGRQYFSAIEMEDGRVLVPGGWIGGNSLSSVNIYDPVNGTWELASPMNESRASPTVNLLPDKKVLVGGGNFSGSVTYARSTSEISDPVNDTWTLTDDLNVERAGPVAINLPGGSILTCGGIKQWNPIVTLPTCEIYSSQSPPIVDAGGPYSVNEGGIITLTASASDPDGGAINLTWDLDGDGIFETNGQSVPFSTELLDGPSTFTVEVKATDIDGLSSIDAVSIEIPNVAPIAIFESPENVNEGDDIYLSLSSPYDPSSEDTNSGFQYEFDCGSGYGPTINNNVELCPTDDDGIRNVKGRIIDNDGDSTEYSDVVVINNVKPIVSITGNEQSAEGEKYFLTLGEIIDPGKDTVSELIVNWGDGNINKYPGMGVVNHTYADGDNSFTITVDLIDEDGKHINTGSKSIQVNNSPPKIYLITADPLEPIRVGDPISVTVTFSDPGIVDTHTVEWIWGFNNKTILNDATSPALATHLYQAADVYTAQITVTDKDGDSDTGEYKYLVIYNPEGGFVTGGGWFWSEAGYCQLSPDCETQSGKAHFGFVSKYKKGTNIPTGHTEFQFKAGKLNFHSENYQWMVIAGKKVMYKGEGTINGEGNYGFMISAIDEALTPSMDVDLFRIKIWDKSSDKIVYDNLMDADEYANPTTEIQGGNIVIHK